MTTTNGHPAPFPLHPPPPPDPRPPTRHLVLDTRSGDIPDLVLESHEATVEEVLDWMRERGHSVEFSRARDPAKVAECAGAHNFVEVWPRMCSNCYTDDPGNVATDEVVGTTGACQRCGGTGRVERVRTGHGVTYTHICDGCEGTGRTCPRCGGTKLDPEHEGGCGECQEVVGATPSDEPVRMVGADRAEVEEPKGRRGTLCKKHADAWEASGREIDPDCPDCDLRPGVEGKMQGANGGLLPSERIADLHQEAMLRFQRAGMGSGAPLAAWQKAMLDFLDERLGGTPRLREHVEEWMRLKYPEARDSVELTAQRLDCLIHALDEREQATKGPA